MTPEIPFDNETSLQIRLSYCKAECEAALKEADRQCRIAMELTWKIIEIEEMLGKVNVMMKKGDENE